MRRLPKKYMLKSHLERSEMHEDICAALENVSSASLQQIFRQLQDADAKRKLMREIIISLEKGYSLDATLIQINNTIDRDAEYEE